MGIHHVDIFVAEAEPYPQPVFSLPLVLPCRAERAEEGFDLLFFDPDPSIADRVFDVDRLPFLLDDNDFDKDLPNHCFGQMGIDQEKELNLFGEGKIGELHREVLIHLKGVVQGGGRMDAAAFDLHQFK